MPRTAKCITSNHSNKQPEAVQAHEFEAQVDGHALKMACEMEEALPLWEYKTAKTKGSYLCSLVDYALHLDPLRLSLIASCGSTTSPTYCV